MIDPRSPLPRSDAELKSKRNQDGTMKSRSQYQADAEEFLARYNARRELEAFNRYAECPGPNEVFAGTTYGPSID